jgi:HlyD family secretion protein
VPEQASPVKAEAVAALGQLMPAGDIRSLAAPTAGIAGTPRISALHVKEGAVIQRGEVLATFDHRQGLLADLEEINAKLRSLEQQIALQTVEVSRFQKAAEWGAAERVLVDNKREELIRMQGQRSEALASRKGLQTDLALSQLISPIDGLVLEIHSREGERPGSDGVMDVGASQKMEAKIEVYESDVARIQLGQIVRLTSENGGFKGNLNGQVIRISPQVEQRAVLSTDPTGDADARVVQVDVALDPADAKKVMRLAGLKVIARFQSNP